jgi:hypothetical protein
MHRRHLLKLLALAPAPALAGCGATGASAPELASAEAPAPTGTFFYVSPTGDDRASGRSRTAAWQSITHVNAQLANGGIGVYDTVLFEGGQTHFGKIRIPRGRPTGGGYLTIGAYPGGRRRPVISSYTLLNNASDWRRTGPNLWTTDLTPRRAAGRGYDGAQGGADNIGFLRIDGVVHGRRVWRPEDQRAQWDFRCATNALHVWSTANPASLARDIRASCDGHCIALGNSVHITGLRLEGSGGHGIQGSATQVRVDNNELAELGGALLKGTTRYGNGVEAWIDSADFLVERNILHDIYDVALTAQGGPTSNTGSWRDLTFRNNLVYSCNQSIEFWSDGTPGPGRGFVNCLVECNTCLYAGYVWSATVRPDRDRSVHLLTYGWTLPADITVRNNTFYDATGAYRYSSAPTPGLKCSGNLIVQRTGGRLKLGDPETIEQAPAWVAATRDDVGSTFQVLPQGTRLDVAGALRRVAGQRGGCSPPPLP